MNRFKWKFHRAFLSSRLSQAFFMLYIWHHGGRIKMNRAKHIFSTTATTNNITAQREAKRWLHVFNIHLSTIKKGAVMQESNSTRIVKIIIFYFMYPALVLLLTESAVLSCWGDDNLQLWISSEREIRSSERERLSVEVGALTRWWRRRENEEISHSTRAGQIYSQFTLLAANN